MDPSATPPPLYAAHLSFSLTLCTLLVAERFLNAIAVLLASLVLGRSRRFGVSEVKSFASIQMIGAGASFVTSIASALSSAFLSAVPSLLSYLFWGASISFLFAGLYVVQEYYPGILIGLVDHWNQSLGGYIHAAIVVPLRIFDVAFGAVVPAYNFGVWVATQFVYNALVPNALRNSGELLDLANHTAALLRDTFVSGSDYIRTFAYGCQEPVTDACYDPGRRVMDLITPMRDLRGVALAARGFARGMCTGATGPLDVLIYPLLDINTAKAAHNLLNAVLYTLIHVPSVTVQRCRHQNGDLIMCLPDFEPPINMAIAGLRSLGQALDNWLNVASIVIQDTVLPGSAPDCAEESLSLTYANYSREAFTPGERIRVVGLTEGLYAVTDGRDIQYFSHYGAAESVVAVEAWPFPVDVSMGVAAVTYHDDNPGERDTIGNPSTAMLGCACEDTESEGMRIRCAIAIYGPGGGGGSGNASSASSLHQPELNVVFHKRSTAMHMRCSSSEISVQSVRWPATRFTRAYRGSEPDLDGSCQSRLTCNYVDATVWVAPLCSSSTAAPTPRACVPSFPGAACYPYCMAARRSGSGHDGMVLYNAPDWRDRVHIVDRDCAVETQVLSGGGASSAQVVSSIESGRASYSADGGDSGAQGAVASSITRGDPLGGEVRLSSWDPDLGCVQSSGARSTVSVGSMPGYSASPSGGESARHRSVLLPGQPFAFAGDTTLTGRVDPATGEHYVRVDRLFGNEARNPTHPPPRLRR